MNNEITPRLTPEQIARLRLHRGSHMDPEDGHCLLEVVSMFAGSNPARPTTSLSQGETK